MLLKQLRGHDRTWTVVLQDGDQWGVLKAGKESATYDMCSTTFARRR